MRVLLTVALTGCIANEIVVRNVGGDDTGTVDPGVDPGTRERLTVTGDACANPGQLAPFPGEEGHLVAAVLTPTQAPFAVTRVEVVLATDGLPSGETCNAARDQRLFAWVHTGSTPPAAADTVQRWSWPGIAPSGDTHVLARELDEPILLGPGESLVLGFPYPGTWPDVSCVQLCNGDATASFWSNAVDAPYAWAPLSDLGFTRGANLSAEGYVVPP